MIPAGTKISIVPAEADKGYLFSQGCRIYFTYNTDAGEYKFDHALTSEEITNGKVTITLDQNIKSCSIMGAHNTPGYPELATVSDIVDGEITFTLSRE